MCILILIEERMIRMSIDQYELLAPAGDAERLDTALRFGADAVYIGGPMLQLRAGNAGFTMDGVRAACAKAHSKGKKLYVAVNVFASNDEVDAVGDYARELKDAGVDAVIVSDLGLIRTIRHTVPELDVHVSTQANCLNYASAMTYYDMGVKRVVLGREMSLREIEVLRTKIPDDLELEAFVHGAMCMSYSGRCMISAYLTGRSGNKGACAQSCRWKYALMEEKRPGMYFPVEEDERGMTILSSFDMRCLEFLDRLMNAGIKSFKIEGRMKSPFYVATVVNAYRRRIDSIMNGRKDDVEELLRELDSASHRPYASGFYFGEMKHHAPDDGVYLQDTVFVGIVREKVNDRVVFELRNRFFEGDRIEVLSPNLRGGVFAADDIRDMDGNAKTAASVPNAIYTMRCDLPLEAGDILRVRK